jgi:hypothetical protein
VKHAMIQRVLFRTQAQSAGRIILQARIRAEIVSVCHIIFYTSICFNSLEIV